MEDNYASLRQSEDRAHRTQPVTPRALETMIRLAEASAKSRLSRQVEKKDAMLAVRFIRFRGVYFLDIYLNIWVWLGWKVWNSLSCFV